MEMAPVEVIGGENEKGEPGFALSSTVCARRAGF
jgi:hypothetical protein